MLLQSQARLASAASRVNGWDGEVEPGWHEGIWQLKAQKVGELGNLYFTVSGRGVGAPAKEKGTRDGGLRLELLLSCHYLAGALGVEQIRWDKARGQRHKSTGDVLTSLVKVQKQSIEFREHNPQGCVLHHNEPPHCRLKT